MGECMGRGRPLPSDCRPKYKRALSDNTGMECYMYIHLLLHVI